MVQKPLPGIFLGYALHAGGLWKGDILIADIEELVQTDASEIHARRLNAKEVLTPMKGDNLIFPVADGTVKISGGDQRLRTSTIWDRPERGEEQEVLQGEPGGLSSPRPHQDNSTLDDAEAKNDFYHHRRIISYSAEIHRRYQKHIHHSMYGWRKILMIVGTWMEIVNCQVHGPDSQNLRC